MGYFRRNGSGLSQLKEDDEQLLSKLEEYARLQVELDRRVGSLSLGQLVMMIAAFVILVFFLGFVGELFFAGSPFGIIVASVLASLAVTGMSNGIKGNGIRKFLEDQKEAREAGFEDRPSVKDQDNEQSG
jgi:hypothetical protein